MNGQGVFTEGYCIYRNYCFTTFSAVIEVSLANNTGEIDVVNRLTITSRPNPPEFDSTPNPPETSQFAVYYTCV